MTVNSKTNIDFLISSIDQYQEASVLIFSCYDERFGEQSTPKKVVVHNNILGRSPEIRTFNKATRELVRCDPVAKGLCRIFIFDQCGASIAPIDISINNTAPNLLDELMLVFSFHRFHNSILKLYSQEDWIHLFNTRPEEIQTWSGLDIKSISFSRKYSDFGWKHGILEVSANNDYFPQKQDRVFYMAWGPGTSYYKSHSGKSSAEEIFDYYFDSATFVDISDLSSYDNYLRKYKSHDRNLEIYKPKQIQKFLRYKGYTEDNEEINEKDDFYLGVCGEIIQSLGTEDLKSRGYGAYKKSFIYPQGMAWNKKLSLFDGKKIWVPKVKGIARLNQAFGVINVFVTGVGINTDGTFYVQLKFFSSEDGHILRDIPEYADIYGTKYLSAEEVDRITFSNEYEGAELEYNGVLELNTEPPYLSNIQ